MKFTDGFWQLRPGRHGPLRARGLRHLAGHGHRGRTRPRRHGADDRHRQARRHAQPSRAHRHALVAARGRRARAHRAPRGRSARAGLRSARCRRGRRRRGIRRPRPAERSRPARSRRGSRTGAPWSLSFEEGGRRLTGSGHKAQGYMQLAPDAQVDPGDGRERACRDAAARGTRTFVHEQLDLGVGELIYGLGERFGPAREERPDRRHLERRRRHVERAGLQERAVLPLQPRLRRARERPGPRVVRDRFGGRRARAVLGRGRGARVLRHRRPDAEGRARRATPRSPGGRRSCPRGRTDSGCRRASRPTTTRRPSRRSSTGWRERELPVSVFHFDCFWMREFNWCDFEWDPRVFPDPDGMLARLHETDLRVCVWINPYIAQRSPLFAEAAGCRTTSCARPTARSGSGTCGRRAWGSSTSRTPRRPPGTRASCGAWSIRASTASRPTSASGSRSTSVWHDGSDPVAHAQPLRAALQPGRARRSRRGARRGRRGAVRALRDRGRAVACRCTGAATRRRRSRRWPRRSAAGSRSRSAASRYWSHDIGGFEGTPDAAVFKRWMAFGLLGSHTPLPRVAVLPRAVGVRRGGGGGHARLRAPEDAPHAVPVPGGHRGRRRRVRRHAADAVGVPGRPGLSATSTGSTCSAPTCSSPRCFSETARSSSTCPPGTWTHLLTGETVEGGGVATRDARLRLACRCTFVPARCCRGARARTGPTTTTSTGLTLRVFPGGERYRRRHGDNARRASPRRSRSTVQR